MRNRFVILIVLLAGIFISCRQNEVSRKNKSLLAFKMKYVSELGNDDYEKVMKRWRKEKSFAIKDAGYHTYFGMASTSLANDADFEVQDDATKAQIKRAFFKSLKNKKMNKKILGEFIELVA